MILHQSCVLSWISFIDAFKQCGLVLNTFCHYYYYCYCYDLMSVLFPCAGPVPYYIVRNSWGTEFGIKGFMYIKVGENLCGK